MLKHLLILVSLQLGLSISGLAQETQDYAGCGKYTGLVFSFPGDYSDQYASPAELHAQAREFLQTKYAIKLTKDELRSSLRSHNAQVRYLAAWALADSGYKDTNPDIFRALKAETQPRPKAYLACALTELGDPRGVEALQQLCKDRELNGDLRLDVARFLAEIHETPCVIPAWKP